MVLAKFGQNLKGKHWFSSLPLPSPLRIPRESTWRHLFPQTVLALWGSGVFKAGDPNPGFPASRTFPDTENHQKTMSLVTFSKKMELALEFRSLPFRFLMNASANLLVFVAKCLGVS